MSYQTQNEKIIGQLNSWIKASENIDQIKNNDEYIHDGKSIMHLFVQLSNANIEIENLLPNTSRQGNSTISAKLGAFLTRCKAGVAALRGVNIRTVGSTIEKHRCINRTYAADFEAVAKILLNLHK